MCEENLLRVAIFAFNSYEKNNDMYSNETCLIIYIFTHQRREGLLLHSHLHSQA